MKPNPVVWAPWFHEFQGVPVGRLISLAKLAKAQRVRPTDYPKLRQLLRQVPQSPLSYR